MAIQVQKRRDGYRDFGVRIQMDVQFILPGILHLGRACASMQGR